MAARHPRLSALAAALAAVAIGAPAAASPPASVESHPDAPAVAQRAGQPVETVRAYWTAARMRGAEPVVLRLGGGGPARAQTPEPPGPALTVRQHRARRPAVETDGPGTTFPERVHGKAFFTISGGSEPGDYVCSATVVASPSHSLAWTAGHCVNDTDFGGGFATNWAFVPGYRDGQRPYGTWPARRLYTTSDWEQNGNLRVDLGAATLVRDPEGRGIEDIVGARGIAFNQSRDQEFQAFGYPAVPTLLRPDFNGERLYTCASGRTGSDNPPGAGPTTLEIQCDLSAGASGGSWVADRGLVASVTSYGYFGDFDHLYGPYLGTTAEALYSAARGAPVLCAGRAATNLGAAGPNDFLGTEGADAIKLRSGGDIGRGGVGRDRICGGSGRDVLRGGPGRDICVGGPGRDRAPGCERRLDIP